MELAVLCRFYRDRVNEWSYAVAEQVTRIPHGTLANVVAEADRLDLPPAARDGQAEYRPHPYMRLDLEAYYWLFQDQQEADRVREDRDVPLPPDNAAAVVSMLSRDPEEALEEIAGIEEALRAYKGKRPPPHRVAEVFRRLYEQGTSAIPSYGRQRMARKPRPPKPDSAPPPPPSPGAPGEDAAADPNDPPPDEKA